MFLKQMKEGMNKKRVIILFSVIIGCIILGCLFFQTPDKPALHEIPEQNINYTNFQFGNVIDEGKQAVFLNFESDYNVEKMEYAGVLLDISGQTLYAFDSSLTYSPATKKPQAIVRIDKNLISKVHSVQFTKIKAYTKDQI